MNSVCGVKSERGAGLSPPSLNLPLHTEPIVKLIAVGESAPKWAGYGSPCARPRSGRSAGLRVGPRRQRGMNSVCGVETERGAGLSPPGLNLLLPATY